MANPNNTDDDHYFHSVFFVSALRMFDESYEPLEPSTDFVDMGTLTAVCRITKTIPGRHQHFWKYCPPQVLRINRFVTWLLLVLPRGNDYTGKQRKET